MLQHQSGSLHGFGGSPYLERFPQVDEAAVAFADLMQSVVLNEMFGPPWPVCPGHPHPATAELIRGEAMWVCPNLGGVVVAIGHLVA